MHPRTEIREIIKTALTDAAIPHISGRIFISRTQPLQEPELPAISVFYAGENINDKETDPPQYWRLNRWMIEILDRVVSRDYEAADLKLDTISRAVEIALLSSPSIAKNPDGSRTGPINKIRLVETRPGNAAGEYSAAALTLLFEIEFIENIFDAQALDDFLRFTAKITGPENDPDSAYEINISQEIPR